MIKLFNSLSKYSIKIFKDIRYLDVEKGKYYSYSLFSSSEWIRKWYKYLGKDIKLFIFVYGNEKNNIIFPLCMKDGILQFVCSKKTDYNYPIEKNKNYKEFFALYKGFFDVVLPRYDILFKNLPKNSILGDFLLSNNGDIFQAEVLREKKCPCVDLSKFAFSKMSKRYLNDIQKGINGLSELHQITVNNCSQFEYFLEIFFRLNKEWWQFKDFDGLISNESEKSFFKETLIGMFKENKVLLSVLLDGDKPISISLNFKEGDTIYNYSSGHSLEYRDIGIGKIHLFFLFKEILKMKFKYFDFMRGEEDYKYKWLAKDRYNMDILLKKY